MKDDESTSKRTPSWWKKLSHVGRGSVGADRIKMALILRPALGLDDVLSLAAVGERVLGRGTHLGRGE